MKAKSLDSKKLEWKDAPGYPAGAKIKVLREEEEPVTFLLKLPKGLQIEAHSHITAEEHFILEGEYESGGEVFETGAYRLIPAHLSHGPFVTQKETIILVIRETAALDQQHPPFRV